MGKAGKSVKTFILLMVSLLMFLSPGVAEPQQQGRFYYTIGDGDVLDILVWREPDLSRDVVVRPDGKISFPLAGEIPAAGSTFSQLEKELTQRLRRYLKYPVVSVSLKKIGGKKVIVLGQVRSPGVYSVSGRRTVLEAIAQARGFTNDAVPSSIILIRGGLQEPQGQRLNLSRTLSAKSDSRDNLTLQPEDVIFVPKKFIANVNYFLEQILGPLTKGGYEVSDFAIP